MSKKLSLAQIEQKNRIDPELKYSNKLKIKLKQLSEKTHKPSNLLPNIYAKAEELNRRLSVSTALVNSEHDLASASILSKEVDLENMNEKDKDAYLKAYRSRKRSIIVSKYLDDEMKQRLEQLKYSASPSRRQSINDTENSNSHSTELDNDYQNSSENFYDFLNRNSKNSGRDFSSSTNYFKKVLDLVVLYQKTVNMR